MLAEDDELVEALGFDRQDKSLGIGIEIWGGRADFHRLDPVRFEAVIKRLRELRIKVVDQVRRRRRVLVGQQDEIPSLLQDPLRIGVSRHPRDNDSARSDVKEEQDVIIDQASRRPDFLGEEIAGPERGKTWRPRSSPQWENFRMQTEGLR